MSVTHSAPLARTAAGFLAAALLAAPVAALAARETIEETFAFAPGSHLEVKNSNGLIEVIAWDRADIEIEARKHVSGDADRLADLEVIIREHDGGVRIDTRQPSRGWWGRGNNRVDYTIRVPVQAALTLENANGRVSVDGVDGEMELSTVNGSIVVADGAGSIDTEVTNGSTDVELVRVDEDASMRLEGTNGSITLRLPDNINASIDARTVNGSVRSDLPITIMGNVKKNRLQGELGDGGPRLRVSTVNGSIRIKEV